MASPVITSVARALDRHGVATLRFNFRGVGSSQGKFANGSEEVADVRSAIDLFRKWPGVDSKRLVLVGYSFGAQVILRGLSNYGAAKALVLVSPPLSSFTDSKVGNEKRPKLFLVGEKDKLVSAQRLQEAVDALPQPCTMEIVLGADHSWGGHEAELAEKVAQFVVQVR
jgi:alpha/beta superfamily hydrolase